MLAQSYQANLDAKVAVVIPAYNEEAKIGATLAGIPAFVATIYAVNDASSDGTAEVIRAAALQDPRIRLIDLPVNSGVGGAIVAGYQAGHRQWRRHCRCHGRRRPDGPS
jgi:glycosyltransferase involved in cell wall biosynthesis